MTTVYENNDGLLLEPQETHKYMWTDTS